MFLWWLGVILTKGATIWWPITRHVDSKLSHAINRKRLELISFFRVFVNDILDFHS